MLVWFYRPKNIVFLIGGTFLTFVFVQVFVLVPNPDGNDGRRSQDKKNPDSKMHQSWRAGKEKLDMLKNINLNIKNPEENHDNDDKIHFDALKPIYDTADDAGFVESDREGHVEKVIEEKSKAVAIKSTTHSNKKMGKEDVGSPAINTPAPKEEGGLGLDKPSDLAPPPKEDELISLLSYVQKHLAKDSSKDGLLTPLAYNRYTDNCTVFVKNEANHKTPFKLFVLDLPPRYNTDLVQCVKKVDKCFKKTSHCGFGPEMYTEHNQAFTVHDNWQFSLEIVLHHKLLLSPYRTLNISKAAAIYVPYYAALDCFCSMSSQDTLSVQDNIKSLIRSLSQQHSFISKTPYFMALGKIEREHMTGRCPWLTQPAVVQELTYIGIEQEPVSNLRFQFRRVPTPLILAPYPSYGHLSRNHGKDYIDNLYSHARPVFVFLAAGTRRSNPFRAQILDQFKEHRTSVSMHDYLKANSMADGDMIKKAWLTTPECQGRHQQYTMMWMKHATFCLQPPGDSPTRKSIYDAILSGCIPVFFKQEHLVKYPFQNKFNYEQFSVTIPQSTMQSNVDIYEYLWARYNKKTIENMQRNLHEIVPYFQYSFPLKTGAHDDAVQMILEELQERLHL